MDWGLLAGDFERLEDGTYVCQVNGFSPTWIRCIADHGDHIEHLDAGGATHIYRVVPRTSRAASS